MKNKFIWLVFFTLLFNLVTSPNLLCSTMCTNACTGNTFNDCGGKCLSNWIVSGTSCAVNTLNQFSLEGVSDDFSGLGGVITFTPANGPFTCGPYTYYGVYGIADAVTVDFIDGVIPPCYQIIAYVSILGIDTWSAWTQSNAFIITFVNLGTINTIIVKNRV